LKKFNNFKEVNTFLEGLGLFHMDLSLNRVEKGLKLLGLASPSYLSIQVVGTNGKGSTSAFLESLASAHKLKTGLFTSPHLVSVRERIRINKQELPSREWVEGFNYVYHFCKNLHLTYFEYIFLLACYLFSKHQVDLAIFEAGLGGRFDATTVLPHPVLVFTSIDLDHSQILGSTLTQIATDKAGAIKSKQILISAPQTQEVVKVLTREAQKKQATLLFCNSFFKEQNNSLMLTNPEFKISLSPYLEPQTTNLKLALATWELIRKKLNLPFNSGLLSQGISSFFLPGRIQKVSSQPEIFLDVAHNPHGLKHLKQSLQKLNFFPQMVIFSCLKDKDWKQMLSILQEFNATLYFYPLTSNPRALSWEEVKKSYPTVKLLPDLEELNSLNKPTLICGSFYLLALIYAHQPEWLNKNLLNP
jgi:dihydrofolate synthase/folylpolyglutamate synthase